MLRRSHCTLSESLFNVNSKNFLKNSLVMPFGIFITFVFSSLSNTSSEFKLRIFLKYFVLTVNFIFWKHNALDLSYAGIFMIDSVWEFINLKSLMLKPCSCWAKFVESYRAEGGSSQSSKTSWFDWSILLEGPFSSFFSGELIMDDLWDITNWRESDPVNP